MTTLVRTSVGLLCAVLAPALLLAIVFFVGMEFDFDLIEGGGGLFYLPASAYGGWRLGTFLVDDARDVRRRRVARKTGL